MRTLFVCFLTTATFAMAQDNPISAFNKLGYSQVKAWILGSAEKMPEENYSFKPAETVRSFGQIVGHVADAQYLFCAPVLGEPLKPLGIEKTKTTKADLIASLKESFAYCDKAYDGFTDAAAPQMVKLFNRELPKIGALNTNISHMAEHYGNLVTYMRIKNVVPPSSEPRPPAQKKSE